MRYVDVFISHKLEDLPRAKELKALIKSWNFTCYVDEDDAALQKLRDPAEMSARIRDNLRTCRCFIYAFSSKSAQSKWMPWELGFFDGRWGQRQIGLFDLDVWTGGTRPRAGGGSRTTEDDVGQDALSLQEYLRMYELVDRDNLESFIRRCASTRALADRADVDVDRAAALMAGALRNPAEFAAGCMQYAVSMQREVWSNVLPASAAGLAPLTALEQAFGALRDFAGRFEAPRHLHAVTDESVGASAKVSGGAMQKTYAGPPPVRGGAR